MNEQDNDRARAAFGYSHRVAASLLAVASISCHAQSSVTIQGALDLAVRVVRNDSTLKTLSSNGTQGSRIAFRGEEDLGDGLRAGFWLESAFAPDTGDAGGSNGISAAYFNRRSTVQLSGKLGELRLGRDYVPSYWNLARNDPFNTNGVGNVLNLEPQTASLGSSAFTLLRANNAVAYLTPDSLGGFFAHAMVAAGEGTAGGAYRGLRVGYRQAGLDVALGAGTTKADAAGNPFKVVNVGASYDFGVVRPMMSYQKATYRARRQDNWMVGAIVPFGVHELRASFQRADQSGSGTDRNDATQVAVGYTYRLSKRTSLYSNVSRVSNSGAQTYRVPSGSTLRAGGTSSGAEVGMLHTF